MRREKITDNEIKERMTVAMAVIVTVAVGVLLFCRHWRFELPGYPNVDEQLSLGCIYELLNQHLYAGDIYVLDFFRYPHLTFYYAVIGVRILGKIYSGTDTVILLRYVVCGTAVISNVCMYFSVKIMTNSRRWGYIGCALSVFSLYGYSYLFYTGPDTMMYAVTNLILLLGVLIYKDEDEERVVYLWYPLLAVCIGLAMAAKYHGVVFGVFWLALHIRKKYWKSYRDNFCFFLDCIVLALVFCVCDYSMFFHFKTFIGDNLYNLNHYAWGHPGIEHNFSLLGYLEVFGLTSYGIVGGLLLLLGVAHLFWKKEWGQIVIFALMPVLIILLLSKYQIVLGRNLSLVMPFAFLFMVYGLMAAEKILQTVSGLRKAESIVMTAACLMVLCNILAVCNHYRYDLTYTQAEKYVAEQIPEGAVIYCTDYGPLLDTEKYTVIEIGEDISMLPGELAEGEYYIDVQYATGYFFQKKDYLFWQGSDMYPEKRAAWTDKVSNYTLVQDFRGISYGREWKYRVGYLDIFRYSPKIYYVGPAIAIYAGS